MKAKEIKEKYDSLYAIAKGKAHKFKDMYPICVLLENDEESVYLDSGGQLGYSCIIRIDGNYNILAQDEQGYWKVFAKAEFRGGNDEVS